MKYFRFVALLCLVGLLAACSSGGGGSPPPPPTTFSISGSVSGPHSSGVTVTLSGAASNSTSTASDGSYSFTGLANGAYTVTPTLSGYIFNPSSKAVTVSGANVTATNFTQTANSNPTYKLSGTVSGVSGAPQANVTISLSGAGSASTFTASDGTYSFASLLNGAYTVTPTLAGYIFSPSSKAVTISSADSTGNNFISTVVQTYSISGAVSGDVTAGVRIDLTGASTANTTTAANGSYSFTSLANGTYTVAPSLAGYTFNPNSTSGVAVNNANVSGIDFVASSYSGPTYTISGTVTGPWVEGVTVTLSGSSSGTVTTNASGNYSFASLPGGPNYTVTPSLSGYTYSPANKVFNNLSADASQNFAGASAITSYSVSGTVSYSGSKTGRTFIYVYDANCTGDCSARAATSLSAPGAYIIRGLTPGNYVVVAIIRLEGNGFPNVADPKSTPTTFSITNSNVTGVNITATDPTVTGPVTLTGLSVSPGDSSAFIMYNPPTDNNNQEYATSYKVYWGTDANATNGTPKTFPAQGDYMGFFMQSGLTNGSDLYYKISAVNFAGTESTPSDVVGPITIGPTAGLNTVSGTVTLPMAATGPLMVGIADPNAGNVYFVSIPTPTGLSVSYSVAGIPNGTYYLFAMVDMDNDGEFDVGDVSNIETNQSPPLVTVSGNASIDLTLDAADARTRVSTDNWFNGSSHSYNVGMRVSEALKKPVAATIFAGPHIPVPFDMNVDRDNGGAWFGLDDTSPTVGDTYQFQVTFSDGTTQNMTGTVTAVLSSFAQNLSETTTGQYSRNIPLLTWSAPASPPASYTYEVQIYGNDNNWYYSGGNQSDGIPSTTTSVVFNVDGKASGSSLTTGTIYNYSVQVRDANNNSATYETTYTPSP